MAEDLPAVPAKFDPNCLRRARIAKGFKRKELAKKLNLSPSAITQYETGDIQPSASTLASWRWCWAYRSSFSLPAGR